MKVDGGHVNDARNNDWEANGSDAWYRGHISIWIIYSSFLFDQAKIRHSFNFPVLVSSSPYFDVRIRDKLLQPPDMGNLF